ncbi:hypothetical protein [Sporosarcina psychrophila]|uniref:Large polyvalent protein associated domain-containing protein n=1 Tax=Sporosarcina psychrophila TaxID=1476 RepID=A0ABV2KCH8_SPOPS
MEEIYTLKEAVLWKGNHNQIERLKSEGKLYRSQVSAIETRLIEEYENVEIIGKGKNIEFVLSNKRVEPIDLVNINRGPKPSDMALALEKLVAMKMIENNLNKKGLFHFPINKFMDEFEIADKKFCYYEKNKKHHLNELEKVDIHRDISDDVFTNVHSNFKNAIFRALKELEKKKLEKWYKIPYAKYYRTEVAKTIEDDVMEVDGEIKVKTTEEWFAPLDVKIAKEIDDKVKYLEEQYALNYWSARNANNPEAEEFMQKYNETHAFYGIRFKYDAYCSYLTKTDKKVREKLELPTTPEEAKTLFDIVAKKHNLELAESRQTRGFGKVDRAVHQAKIDGDYVKKTETTYDYLVIGKDLPKQKKTVSKKESMPDF